MHVCVSLSYERWNAFVGTEHWKKLVSIVIQKKSTHFSAHLNRLGIVGLALVSGSTIGVVLGWIEPVWAVIFTNTNTTMTFDAMWFFMLLHACLMSIIVVPWTSVCITSMLLSHVVAFMHQSDMDMLWDSVVSLVSSSNDHYEAMHYNPCMHMHFKLRSRLRKTCHHFQWIHVFTISMSFLLVTSGTFNVNFMLAEAEHETMRWNHLVQDCFCIGIGLILMVGLMWTTSGLTRHFLFLVQKVCLCF